MLVDMAVDLVHVVFDCRDPQRQAAFWAAVLGRPVDPGASELFASIGHDEPSGGRPAWLFVKVTEPKAAKNRVHVDLAADDRGAEVARLIELGATFVSDHEEWGTRWTVLLDPEANEFCVTARPIG